MIRTRRSQVCCVVIGGDVTERGEVGAILMENWLCCVVDVVVGQWLGD